MSAIRKEESRMPNRMMREKMQGRLTFHGDGHPHPLRRGQQGS
jgi:hypothetical protein